MVIMQNQSIIIAGQKILPGTQQVIALPFTSLYTQAKIEIPVHVFHGEKTGPKVFVISTIHGDEINGIEIIHRLHQNPALKKIKGTLLTIPIANIFGFMERSRYLSDRRDLNRCFPGSKKGSLAARLAKIITDEIVTHCDYGIDLHTGAIGRFNMPQLRVNLNTPDIKRLAMAFGAPVILNAKLRDHSLRAAATKLGIPLLVYEAGEALRYNEVCIRTGVYGLLNVLQRLHMINDPGIKTSQEFQHRPIISEQSRWVRANGSGLVQLTAELTSIVKKGDVLGHIHDPFQINLSKKIISPLTGIIIGQTNTPLVNEGDAIYHIAALDSYKAVRQIEAYLTELWQEIAEPHRSFMYHLH